MIQIDFQNNQFTLSFPYNQADLQTVRDLPSRTWKKKEKIWAVPSLAVKSLEDIKAHWTTRAMEQRQKIEKALLILVDYKFDKGTSHSKLRPYQTTGVKFLSTAKKALLADEMGCVAPETLIDTEIGHLSIKEIVERQLQIKVWSFDGKYWQLKSIIRWMKQLQYSSFLHFGPLLITPKHKIYTNAGYIESEKLCSFPESYSIITMGGKKYEEKIFSLPNMRKGKKIGWPKVLQLCSQMESFPARDISQNAYSRDTSQTVGDQKETNARQSKICQIKFREGFASYKNVPANRTLQNNERRSIARSRQRGKWETSFSVPNQIMGSIRRWLGNRVSCPDKKEKSLAKCLQNRYCKSKFENSYRGWQLRKSEKRRVVQGNWVDVSSFLKSNGRDMGGGVSSDGYVYNLTVEDNHNYIANGILVENCGKSIQAITATLDIGAQKTLILCPATLKWNWHAEFVKHYGIEPLVITGDKKTRKDQWLSNEKFKIANYDLLTHDWDEMPQEWDAIIADEAVFLKTHAAQRTKLAKKLKSDYRFALSGLPIENNLLEFHSIFEWARPDLLPNLFRFKYRYCIFGWDGSIIGYKNLDELHMLASPFVLRRTKQGVLKELPPKIYQDIPLEFGIQQRQAYEAIKDELLEWLKNETGKDWTQGALQKAIRLRQFVEFPSLVGINLLSCKLEWLEDLYNSTDKLVVFTFFRESARLLKEYFKTKFYLASEIDPQERIRLVNEFNATERGIFVSTDAGRFGINLTGVDKIVHFGYVYNPAVIKQREDRLHRIGQESVVNVFSPKIMGSIDEGICDIFLGRDREAQEFMEGSEQMALARLSRKDFIRMIEGNR